MRPLSRSDRAPVLAISRLPITQLCTALLILSDVPLVNGAHHMAAKAPRKLHRRKLDITPLLVTNHCPDTIWPGISTQSGKGPSQNGFELKPGETKNQTCSEDWQGRVWGRTNCTFNSDGTGPASGGGKACMSGDCNGALNCQVGVSSNTQFVGGAPADMYTGRCTRLLGRIYLGCWRRTHILRYLASRRLQRTRGNRSTAARECHIG